jgi:hypothetical protein
MHILLNAEESLTTLGLLWIAQKRPDIIGPLRSVTEPSTKNLRQAGMFKVCLKGNGVTKRRHSKRSFSESNAEDGVEQSELFGNKVV